jgi:hypothetical protein
MNMNNNSQQKGEDRLRGYTFKTCKRCGIVEAKIVRTKENEEEIYCTSCGVKLKPEGETIIRRKWVDWKWVYVSIGLILLIQIVSGAVAYILFGHPSGWRLSLFTFFYLLIFFLGSLWAAYLSPEETIKEPAIGSAFLAVFDLIFTGNFLAIALGWILPFLIALGGAKCGEYLQEKCIGSS